MFESLDKYFFEALALAKNIFILCRFLLLASVEIKFIVDQI